ncbi:hypothetical protein HLB23_11685 [Nocardia uniformis]|uniref:Membrane protein YmcC n=1 Tax=Nocardia uniformis TaxID=53432 RepID=A0A849BZE5_9NOCA|nr:hypothetical protein [Nocardia uniformis]NNH70516.1 hypothetical protein [Nocardia uniformis]
MLELLGEHPVAGVILACEVGLWVLLGSGLAVRYLARMRTLSTVILLGIPLLDVVLVIATAIDLRNGATADATHGLAGLYLGFSIAFGPTIVRWADARFAYRFAGGPPPVKAAKSGPERRRYLWREWLRVVNAAAISSVTLLALVLFIATPAQEPTLTGWIGRVWVIVGLWFVFGPLWESGRRDKEPADKDRVDIGR